VPRPITQQNLGAWLLRCNPKNEPELPRLIAGGGYRIERWCVADNYRSRMMAAGDPVVFWISGDGRLLARGIWGVGRVLGVRGFPRPAAGGRPTGRNVDGPGERPSVSVDIPLLAMPVSDQRLRAAGIDDLEVQKQPQGSNPSWISATQLARLAAANPLKGSGLSGGAPIAGRAVRADLWTHLQHAAVHRPGSAGDIAGDR